MSDQSLTLGSAEEAAISVATIEAYERTILAELQRKIGEGVAALKKERAYVDCQRNMDAVMGDQTPSRASALSSGYDNKLKKIVLETASALTDVRPIWNYETHRKEYKPQATVLNKLARAWWRNIRAERKLVSGITFACVGGSGYLLPLWNGEDIEMLPVDPRDVIPIEPVYSDTVQDWRGVAVRQRVALQTLLEKYPTKRGKLQLTRKSWFSDTIKTGRSRLFDMVGSAFTSSISKSSVGGSTIRDGMEGVDLMRVWLKDDTIHTGDAPRTMGQGTPGGEYVVFPVGSISPVTGKPVTAAEAKLYPRGRLIICTPDCVLEDIPNPYWHGMFPVVRFTLDPIPWSLLGVAMVSDLYPLQNGLNEALRGAEDGIQQWVKRGVVADKNSLSGANLDKIDTRRAGMKALVNPSAGEGFKIIDGPELPNWYLQMLDFYKAEMEENSGVRGLQQLQQLKQMPAADTVEKVLDALSPMLRLRAHGMEQSLSELAEMMKVNFIQFYTSKRRFQILGADGLVLEDFDYDPGTLVPDEVGPEQGDGDSERATRHGRNFVFAVAPDSFLNISHALQKMLILQLFRANAIDPYSVWDAMNLTDKGMAPAETIPERIAEARRVGFMPGPPPEVVQAQNAMILIQAQMAMGQAAMGMAGPGGAAGGGAMQPPPTSGVGPQGGRPPSGQEGPQMVQKNGPEGPRTVVSESGR